MIQFNLLPDVKVQYIKAQKSKRIVIAISGLTLVVSLALLGIMISVNMLQNKHIADLNKDIKSYQNNLKGTEDIDKVLTIQKQLDTLPSLYAKRPVTSRIFKYIQATTPTQVSITNITVDYPTTTLSIDGTTDSLESVNRYVDTLKFTTYSEKDSEDKSNAFTEVVLGSFSKAPKISSFTVTLKFNPDIFDAAKDTTLNVPKTITTRSETELPSSGVFDGGSTN